MKKPGSIPAKFTAKQSATRHQQKGSLTASRSRICCSKAKTPSKWRWAMDFMRDFIAFYNSLSKSKIA